MSNHSIQANIPGFGYARILIERSSIASVEKLGPELPEALNCSQGFADLQVNGFAGVDFSAPDLEHEALIRLLPVFWRTGVTSFCPTLITNTIERLERNFRVLETARRADSRFAGSVPCYHLEGPYVSPGPSHGAHDPQWMHAPDWDEFSRLQDAANGNIGIVTVAPELPGALDFIRRASESGVLVALSHTDASVADIHAAAQAGARMNTHLGNGCPPVLHRHQAPFWAQLADDNLAAGIICDTFHVIDDVVKIIYRVKGPCHSILVTDAVHVAGLAPGRYSLVGTPVDLLPSGQVVTADGRCMAGSALSMNRAITNFMRATGAPLADALKLAVSSPARVLPGRRLGLRVAACEPANLALFSNPSGTPADGLRIERVMLGGEWVA